MPSLQILLTALGWSLIKSIWQLAILWVAYFILTANNARFSATGKHNLALVFVFIGAEWFAYSFVTTVRLPTPATSNGFFTVSPSVNQMIPYLSVLYLIVLGIRYMWTGFLFFGKNHSITGRTELPVLQAFADRHVRLLGITKNVRVFLSDLVPTAETSGFLKPLVLLPLSLVTRLSQQQLEAIIVHELFHIRRNDYVINICMSGFRSIFFFNPFAHLFYETVSRERELACDDSVIEWGYKPELYAEALYNLEKLRQIIPGFSLAADGNRPWLLMERIRRVLGKPAHKRIRLNKLVIFSGFMAILLFCVQQKSPPANGIAKNWPAQQDVLPPSLENALVKVKLASKATVVRPSYKKITRPVSVPASRLTKSQPVNPAAETTDHKSVFFTDNKTVRNFSNQQATALFREPLQGHDKTAFVPSVSLSYVALPEILASDSIRETELASSLQDLVDVNRLNTISRLNTIVKEMGMTQKLLDETEIRNRKLILLDQKNILPILKNIHRQMDLKKKEIDRIQIKLRESEEEIIHI
jgi:beta-lactamase regulating signal transducer with metallopeptidase domain